MLKNSLALMCVGGVAFIIASLLGTFASFSVPRFVDQYNTDTLRSVLQAILFIPLFEEIMRSIVVTKLADKVSKVNLALSLGTGWFLAELGLKTFNGVDFSMSKFWGIAFLGALQPLVLHIAYCALSVFLFRRKLWVGHVILSLFAFHSLYNLSVLTLQNYQIGPATPDDLIAIGAFVLTVVLFKDFSILKR